MIKSISTIEFAPSGPAAACVPVPANSNGRGRDDFAEGLVSLRRSLFQRALFLAQDRIAADDLMQETLERALTARRQFRAGSNLRAWLFSIMMHRFIDGRRRASLEQQSCRLAGAGPTLGGANQDAWVDEAGPPDWADEDLGDSAHRGPLDLLSAEDVGAAIATLTPSQQEIFLLAYRERVPHTVIAARLGVAIGTIGTRLFRCRARLRSCLEGLYQQRRVKSKAQ